LAIGYWLLAIGYWLLIRTTVCVLSISADLSQRQQPAGSHNQNRPLRRRGFCISSLFSLSYPAKQRTPARGTHSVRRPLLSAG
jgi:hypothetical protein